MAGHLKCLAPLQDCDGDLNGGHEVPCAQLERGSSPWTGPPARPGQSCALLLPERPWEGFSMPAIAQLVEHLTVDICRYLMVPASIPGGWTFEVSGTAAGL